MDQTQIPWLLALGFAAASIVQTIRLWLRGALPAWRARGRAKVAARGEGEAESLLKRSGFRIRGRQVTQPWSVQVDGDRLSIELRADLLVKKGRRLFVAEVKTGKSAPRIETGATRRQLLEYALAYPVDGVLLVEPERGRIREVRFPLQRGRPWRGLFVGTCIGMIVATAVVLVGLQVA